MPASTLAGGHGRAAERSGAAEWPALRTGFTRWDVAIAVTLTAIVIAHYAVPREVLWVHVVLF